jgi:hypothetical protein
MQDLGFPSVSISTYVEFKVFELFRDRMLPLINQYRKDGGEKDTDLYRHLFLAPENYSKKRVFQVRGVLSPYCCLWATSPLKFNEDFYARSVLPRDFMFKDSEGNQRYETGFLYDYEKSFEFSAGSFFKDFIGQVNQDLLDFDRLRYFKINVDELLFGFSSVCELMLSDISSSEVVDQVSDNRSFTLGAKYNLKITLPIISKTSYISRVRLYLDDHKIYEREVTEVSVVPDLPSHTPSAPSSGDSEGAFFEEG